MSDELVEAVARKLCGTRFLNGGDDTDDGWDDCPEDLRVQYLALARASIAVVIERCAKVAEDETWPDRFVTAAQRDGDDRLVHYNDACLDIGAAIRKLGESE